VPSNKSFKTNDAALKALYDDNARSYYDNFNKSLAQVACDTTSQSQYSLARTCTDCANDYKRWLCSVLIPRCEDWSANNDGSQPWLQPRNVNAPLADGSPTFDGNVSKAFNESTRDRFAFSKSRNPMIDEKIQPGPYLEMKPCEDLCFDIVRSCPAQLGFACPNAAARVISYGKRDPKENELKCNFPGAVVKLNVQGAAETLKVCFASTVLSALLVAVVSLL
jgi:calcium channel MID1